MPQKIGSNNPQQKGSRRQRLQKHQNNKGNPENPSTYKDFEGNPVK